MWDHYQAAAVGDARKRPLAVSSGGGTFDCFEVPSKQSQVQKWRMSGEAISQLQKSFLDQLHSEMDVNAAAAKALLHLKAPAWV